MEQTAYRQDRLATLLGVKDLTKEPHAIALMKDEVIASVAHDQKIMIDGPRVVSAMDNYTLLGYPEDSVMKEKTYTHWVNDTDMLRTQTTSVVLGDLRRRAKTMTECVLIAPGMVYRRDVRDRWHSGTPHQIDVWVLSKHPQALGLPDLLSQILQKVIPGVSVDYQTTSHTYTKNGLEISARWEDRWLEVGEGGEIDPALLERLGIRSNVWGGLALGLGLDRLVMVRKTLPDIRLLRDPLPSVSRQMQNLSPWTSVSRQPSAVREISIARPDYESEESLVEAITDSLDPEELLLLESVEVVSRTKEKDLSGVARSRLGIQKNHENILIKITWQSESQSLARPLINSLMKKIYQSLHMGTSYAYCPK